MNRSHLVSVSQLVLMVGALIALSGCRRSDDDNRPAPRPNVAPLALAPDNDDLVRPRIPQGRPPAADEPATSLQGLLEGMPAAMFPQPGEDFLIERNESRAWLAEKAFGRVVEVTLHIDAIGLRNAAQNDDVFAPGIGGPGPALGGFYDVDLIVTSGAPNQKAKLSDGAMVGNVVLGPHTWPVKITVPTWTSIGAAEARKLRDLKGRDVQFQGRVDDAVFVETGEPGKLVFDVKLENFEPLKAGEEAELGPPPRVVEK